MKPLAPVTKNPAVPQENSVIALAVAGDARARSEVRRGPMSLQDYVDGEKHHARANCRVCACSRSVML